LGIVGCGSVMYGEKSKIIFDVTPCIVLNGALKYGFVLCGIVMYGEKINKSYSLFCAAKCCTVEGGTLSSGEVLYGRKKRKN